MVLCGLGTEKSCRSVFVIVYLKFFSATVCRKLTLIICIC